jgi:hypothetical protein
VGRQSSRWPKRAWREVRHDLSRLTSGPRRVGGTYREPRRARAPTRKAEAVISGRRTPSHAMWKRVQGRCRDPITYSGSDRVHVGSPQRARSSRPPPHTLGCKRGGRGGIPSRDRLESSACQPLGPSPAPQSDGATPGLVGRVHLHRRWSAALSPRQRAARGQVTLAVPAALPRMPSIRSCTSDVHSVRSVSGTDRRTDRCITRGAHPAAAMCTCPDTRRARLSGPRPETLTPRDEAHPFPSTFPL